MDATTLVIVGLAGVLMGLPYIVRLRPAAQEDGLLADLSVVARLGSRMQAKGNVDAVRAANALIEAVLRVPAEPQA